MSGEVILGISDLLPFFIQFALAVLVGALIGIEREHARAELEKSGKIKDHILGPIFGIRSTILFSLLGFMFAFITTFTGESVFIVVGLIFALTIATSVYLSNVFITKHTGATTYISVLVVFFVGALVGFGGYANYIVAGAVSIIVTFLLALKRRLTTFSTKLTNEELMSALKFGVIAFIILPLLPNTPIDPWGVINPFSVWFVVVAVSTVYFISYIMLKEFSHKGILVSSFFGGLINSAATALHLAAIVKEKKNLVMTAAAGICVAMIASMVSDLVVVFFVIQNIQLILLTILPYVVGMAVLVFFAFWDIKHQHGEGEKIKLKSPFALKPALEFGVIYLLLLVVSSALNMFLGNIGLTISTVVGSMWSSSTVIFSLANLSKVGVISFKTAAQFNILAVSVATMVKCMWVNFSLNKGFSKKVLYTMIATTAAIIITALIEFLFIIR